jgi:hypothetical protein
MQQMDFGHHGNCCRIPGWRCLFFSGDLLFLMTPFANGFVRLDARVMRCQVGDFHRAATCSIGAGQMLMLQRLQKSMVRLPVLLFFHPLFPSF